MDDTMPNTEEAPDDDEALKDEDEEAQMPSQPSEDSVAPVDDAEEMSEIEGKGRYYSKYGNELLVASRKMVLLDVRCLSSRSYCWL